jgi:DNA polymerase-3 subunit epsilon
VADSERIHGLSDDFLADKPKFAEVAGEFIEFIRGADLVIHNAAFDVGFLDNELGLLDREGIAQTCGEVIDTLRMAREMRPGKKNNLDALCNEFGVDNSGRQLHGALLDAELLAEVYLAMTRGQNSLEIAFEAPRVARGAALERSRLPLRVLEASAGNLPSMRACSARSPGSARARRCGQPWKQARPSDPEALRGLAPAAGVGQACAARWSAEASHLRMVA